MKNEIQQSLVVFKESFDEFRKQMDQRFTEFSCQIDHRFAEFSGQIDHRFAQVDQRFHRVDQRFDQLKLEVRSEIQQVLQIVTHKQSLNGHRYLELKGEIHEIKNVLPTLATKDQLNQVYESLSQDITYISGDSQRQKRRIDSLEKRVKRLEDLS